MISLLTRLFVFSRDHFACVYCGRMAPGVELVVDHDRPQGRGGGSSDLRNLYTACRVCAEDKGTRTSQEYRQFLHSREQILLKLTRA